MVTPHRPPVHASGGGGPTDLVVVANRLPVTWSPEEGWVRAPGGLVTALETLVAARDTAWYGSTAALGGDGPLPSLPAWPHGRLHQVTIPTAIAAGAIDGMANSTLWPALHGLSERVRWRDEWWEAYIDFNRRFADAVAEKTAPGSCVWIHDYHLLLLGSSLADLRPDLTVGLSLHTPVDEALGELPVAAELVDALTVPQLVGVQTARDRAALSRLRDRHVDGATEQIGEQVVVSPVSVDPQRLDDVMTDPAVSLLAARSIGRAPNAQPARTLLVGADRMDYTKSIAERLVAFDHAFRRGWLDPERVDVVQVAQPSRANLASYREVRLEIERLGHEIGSNWLRSDGTSPLRVVTEPVDRRVVLGLLASADVALVTPVRDGMNLVSKEFSIVNQVHGGVLILSSGAGAAAELGGSSVLVEGEDPMSVARGIDRAMTLDPSQRRRWADERAAIVRHWSAPDWSASFTERLASRQRAST